VSTRTPEQSRTWGNRIATMMLPLRTDIADPVERLRATSREATGAKRYAKLMQGAALEDWYEYLPPPLMRALAWVTTRMLHKGKPSSYNVIISNVPGPAQTLYIGGARLLSFHSIGQVLEGAGLNVTVWSYAGQLNFSFIACREAVPDVWEMVDGVREGLEELKKAAVAA
jgi:diacylglycerol O-acyltransferase